MKNQKENTKLRKYNSQKNLHNVLRNNQSKTCLKYVQNSQNALNNRNKITQNKVKHINSTTQLLYSPFQNNLYLPPHLNSSNIYQNIFRSQCNSWKINKSNLNKSTYDSQLYKYQQKYLTKKTKLNKFSYIPSQIKYLLDQDKALHNVNKLKKQIKQRQKHQDDDLSQQSSIN